MYEIITIRADYEGWWLFENYREKATEIKSFSQLSEAKSYYNEQLVMLRQHFCNELVGKYDIHAFYNNCEIEFCEDCDDDVQIFHSVLFLDNGEIYQYR